MQKLAILNIVEDVFDVHAPLRLPANIAAIIQLVCSVKIESLSMMLKLCIFAIAISIS